MSEESGISLFKTLVLYGLEKFGLFYSQYRGFVYDNNDLKGYGRLQVSVPEVFGENVLDYWAWPDSNFSGMGYGAQCLPRNNDMVWVIFEKGNPRKPLWKHGHFGKGDKPDNLLNVQNYWFKTPGGHTIEFDDSIKSITITNSLGQRILLNQGGIQLLDGSFNGLVKADELKNQLDKTNEVITAITNSLTNWTPVPSDGGAALKTYFQTQIIDKAVGDYSNIKNDSIKHGV